MLSSLRRLSESYIFILCAAIAAGFLLPATSSLIPYNTLFLQAIFLISSLKLDMGEMLKHGKDWKLLLAANAVLLLAFPLLVRLIAPTLVPDMAFALFLLSAMPAGMTSPLLVEVIGGRNALALILTVTTSLLAPFTIPLVIKLAYGTTVVVDIWAMCQNLLLVIFVPFIIAMILKRYLPAQIKRVNERSKPFSLILLGFVVASAISARAAEILANMDNGFSMLWIVCVLFISFFIHHLIGYYGLWWKSREERMTLSVCLTYMNFTLAIYLASTYFHDPKVILPLVLAILPWATLLPIWKRLSVYLP